MDKALRQRMIGAVVLIALGVIFIPMLLDGGEDRTMETVAVDIPEPMQPDFQSRLLPLDDAPAVTPNEAESLTRDKGDIVTPGEEDSFEPLVGDENQSESPSTARDEAPEPDSAPDGNEPIRVPAPEESSAPVVEPADETPVAEETEPAPSALANWFVQVGSFAEESNAIGLRDRLRAAGISAYVDSVTVAGNETHRVIAGPRMSEAEAAALRDEIEVQFGLNGLVISE